MEISKSKINKLSSLSSRKMRLKHGLFLVEGHKSVIDTLGVFNLSILCATDKWIAENKALAEAYGNSIVSCNEYEMRKISSLQSLPEVVAAYRLPSPTDSVTIDEKELYLMLDDIQDPGNMGTIIRTADWFGIKTVLASPGCVDIYNSKCIQATMGSLARVKVIYTDLKDIILSYASMPVYGTLLEGDNIYDSKISGNGFLIFGNEGNGISPVLRELITCPLLIPPYNPESHGDSLNVAASAAIVLSIFRHG